MGDRTYLNIRINPLDWHLVASIFESPSEYSTFGALYKADEELNNAPVGTVPGYQWHWDELELEEKSIYITVYEANYGWYDEMTEAAKTGARFVGHYSYGGEYGPGSIAGYGFRCYPVECGRDGGITVEARLDATGGEVFIDPGDLQNVKSYLDACNKVNASISNLPDSWEEILKLCPTRPEPNG